VDEKVQTASSRIMSVKTPSKNANKSVVTRIVLAAGTNAARPQGR